MTHPILIFVLLNDTVVKLWIAQLIILYKLFSHLPADYLNDHLSGTLLTQNKEMNSKQLRSVSELKLNKQLRVFLFIKNSMTQSIISITLRHVIQHHIFLWIIVGLFIKQTHLIIIALDEWNDKSSQLKKKGGFLWNSIGKIFVQLVLLYTRFLHMYFAKHWPDFPIFKRTCKVDKLNLNMP